MNEFAVVEKSQGHDSYIAKTLNYIKAILELGKFRLSLSVAFSALAAYFIAGDSVSWYEVVILGIGGLLLAMSANAFNQYLERDIDALMDRTANRPLVTGVISSNLALVFIAFGFLVALVMLGTLCWCAALLGAIAWLTYIGGYTILKRKTPRAVELGSISGALPAAIGALVASPHNLSIAILLFIVQFIWQYPHTWIILKLYEKQYSLIGTKVKAPKNFNLSLLIASVIPPLMMIPVGLLINLDLLVVLIVTAMFIIWIIKIWFKFYKTNDDRTLRKFLVVNLLMLPLHYSLFIFLKFLGL